MCSDIMMKSALLVGSAVMAQAQDFTFVGGSGMCAGIDTVCKPKNRTHFTSLQFTSLLFIGLRMT